MKNDEKKCHLKNDKVEHVLLYHFLNDENHTQILSPGKKKQLLLYLYLSILKGKKLELTFSNFLTIKKIEFRFHKPLSPWQKQSTLNRLLKPGKPGKKKGANGMSTL